MGEKLKILVDLAADEAIRNAKGLDKSLDQIGDSAKESGGKLDGLRGALSWLSSNFVITAGDVANFGRKALEAVGELYDLGTSAERAGTALTAYSGSASSAQVITAMVSKAAGGAVDNLTAMQNATRLLSMGLATNATEAAKLTEMAVMLGAAMGKDAVGAFEDFTLLLANQSILRLDTFGISGAAVRARMEELTSSIEGLDSQTAFLQATMEIGSQKLETLKEAGFSAATGVDKVKTSISNLKVAMSKDLTESANKAILAFENLREELYNVQAAESGAEAISKLYKELSAAEKVTLFWSVALEELAERVFPSFDAVNTTLIEKMERYNTSAEKSVALTAKHGQAAESTTPKVKGAADAFEDYAGAVDDTATAFQSATIAGQSLFGLLDTSVKSKIEKAIEQLEFYAAGGGAIVLAFQEITALIEAGLIPPDAGKTMLDDLYVEATELDIQLGNVSKWEGIKDIRDKLGLDTTQEAKDLMDGVVNSFKVLDQARANAYINVQFTGDPAAIQWFLTFSGMPTSGSYRGATEPASGGTYRNINNNQIIYSD